MRDLPDERLSIRLLSSFVVALFLALIPVATPAFGLRWSVGGGIAQPTEIGYYVGPSPRVGASLVTSFTDATLLGVMGDYTSYRTKRRETEGSQWRALLLVEWRLGRGPLPLWCEAFGQFGVGVGRMEYVGVTELEQLVGPAARLAAGLSFRVSRRFAVTTTFSFDRLDTAPNGMDRHYPTMLSLSVVVAFDWPRGGPLVRDLRGSYLRDRAEPRVGRAMGEAGGSSSDHETASSRAKRGIR